MEPDLARRPTTTILAASAARLQRSATCLRDSDRLRHESLRRIAQTNAILANALPSRMVLEPPSQQPSPRAPDPQLGSAETHRGPAPANYPDIFVAGVMLIDRHGDDAARLAAATARNFVECGDKVGAATWLHILSAITKLQRGPRPRTLH
jgi:hypothetical protein